MTDGHRSPNRRTATLLLGSATLLPIASLISNAAENSNHTVVSF